MSLLLDVNPMSGSVETFDYDESTGEITIKRSCDVTAIIDRNKELQNHTDGWVGDNRDMRLAASIPLDVAYKWLVEKGVSCWRREHWPAVRKLLNDPEWRYLRTNTFML